ncbi:MAG: YjhX family toxin [Pseudomonadota bacterium]
MNISKAEQRVLHTLAQGGHIRHKRNHNAKIDEVMCVTRDGYILSDCTLKLFARLKRRGLIISHGGRPYRISQLGRKSVRSQLDNR